MTKIDTNKYVRYMNFTNGEALLNELENPEYSDQVSFKKANEALTFIKAHNEDNEFERVASTPAIITAISYLEEFEKELLKLMIDGVAENDRQKKISKKAHDKATKIIKAKIEPALKQLLSDIESLNSIENYSHGWFTYELQGFADQIKKAMRI